MAGQARSELERLREVERRLTSITRHAPDFILGFDREGVIDYMNRPPPGHELDAVIGTNVRKWMEPAFHEPFARAVEHVFETGELGHYESIGSVTGRYYIHRISPVLVDGEVESAILITHDITEMRTAQRELEASEQRYRALFEASFEGLILSVDGALVYANRAITEMFGYPPEELVGLTPLELATPESAAVIVRNVAAGVETPYEVTCVRKDGSEFPCELLGRSLEFDGRPARLTGLRDLTARKRAAAEQQRREERVRHAQKLETLGVLAGGIAHDFNNLLAVIRACVDLGRRRVHDSVRVEDCLEQIGAAVERATDLTEQLMMYAGRGEREMTPVDLSGLVRDAIRLLRMSISKRAVLTLNLAGSLPQVEADTGQLHQVVMNLVINASEALGDDGGEIGIGTGVVEVGCHAFDAAFADAEPDPGRYAYVEISDTGEGMDDATLSRIFDPFFTTKFAGRGLGLAAVQGIVRGHRGAILVDSERGRGTRFRVLLPVVAEPV